jgi:hypothetical protein
MLDPKEEAMTERPNTGNPAGTHPLKDFRVTPPLGTPAEYQRFEELTRKLVQVTKDDLDEARRPKGS